MNKKSLRLAKNYNINSNKDKVDYLNAQLERSFEDFLHGIKILILIKGTFIEAAKEMKMGRESLYKMLSPGHCIRFSIIESALNYLDIKIVLAEKTGNDSHE